ncbi:hypothetical protein AAFF_G00289940 [Aldrovandia affinis]|uniref:Uncharacterized protein n=1 Tax=Aldrovandia affinis TaxID=143900 RepID=A0AAD7W0X4_9TELE|nr:hypothetical protein AAFF_G00289940 [Aldrovandia affinis]
MKVLKTAHERRALRPPRALTTLTFSRGRSHRWRSRVERPADWDPASAHTPAEQAHLCACPTHLSPMLAMMHGPFRPGFQHTDPVTA